MKTEWNRKVGPYDFRKFHFSKFSKIWIFLFISENHVMDIQINSWASLNGRKIIIIYFRKYFLVSKFCHFQIFKNAWFEILNHFCFNESLYEPFRQWLGWQFTGGSKSINQKWYFDACILSFKSGSRFSLAPERLGSVDPKFDFFVKSQFLFSQKS